MTINETSVFTLAVGMVSTKELLYSVSSGVFLPYFSMLTLSLPLLGLGFKSTSLSPGFCVRRPRQYDTICWELNLISGFFTFFWLIVWADGIRSVAGVLQEAEGADSRAHTRSQVYVEYIIISLHFHIDHIASFLPGIPCPLYCYYK